MLFVSVAAGVWCKPVAHHSLCSMLLIRFVQAGIQVRRLASFRPLRPFLRVQVGFTHVFRKRALEVDFRVSMAGL